MNESLDTKNEKNLWDEAQAEIYARLDSIPEDQQLEELKKILKEYGINEDELELEAPKPEVEVVVAESEEKIEVRPKKKNHETLKKVGKSALWVTGGLAGMIAISLKNTENKNVDVNKEKNYLEIPIQENPKPKEENTVAYEPRFKMEVYNSLPEKSKEVYTYFANNNPTPGRGYMMLDKDSALQYVFNAKNELVAKITAGYGKDMGDENNTSYKLNTGRTTTPSGIYIISNATTEGDRKEYGEMQYSLFGTSVLGEKVTLGIHQTYPKQLELRTNLLNSPNKEDNRFSDGCVNVPVEEFVKNIKPYFQGDGGELMIILPDVKSRESGVAFQIDVLVKKSLEMIVEMADRQEKELRNRLSIVKTTEEYTKIKVRIDELMFRRARAMQILEGK